MNSQTSLSDSQIHKLAKEFRVDVGYVQNLVDDRPLVERYMRELGATEYEAVEVVILSSLAQIE